MMDSHLVALCVVLLFGTSTFFRKIAVDGMSPYHLQVVSGLIYFFLIPLWLYAGAGAPSPTLKNIAIGAITVITGLVGTVVFGFMLKRSDDVSVLSTMASASPVVTALLSVAFLGERLTIPKLIGMALVICGMVLINR